MKTVTNSALDGDSTIAAGIDLRTVVRWTLRAAVAIGLLIVLYIVITFIQVWRAAGADGARSADAIVVLGAAQYDGRPSPVLAARLDHAFELYDGGLADLIVTTGSNQVGDRFTQGFAGYDYLRDLGVPDENLVVISSGSSTFGELRATAREADRFGIQSVVLVTDPFHALRVAEIAEEVGLDASVSPTDGDRSLPRLIEETGGVALGRIISFRRLDSLF